jgi:O-antigen/teichoic acid export membrane protein
MPEIGKECTVECKGPPSSQQKGAPHLIFSAKLFKLLGRYQNINWALADQAMVSGVNFLTGILLARFLGVEAYGRFTLAWISVLFVNSIQMALIVAPMMSIGPKLAEEDVHAYYGSVFVQQACFAVISLILIFVGVEFSQLYRPEWHVGNLSLPLAIAGYFYQSQDFLRRYFFTVGKQGLAIVNDAVSYIGQLVILIGFFVTSAISMKQVLWVIAATSALAVIAGGMSLCRIDWRAGNHINVFLRHWKLSKWLTASAVLQWTSGHYFLIAAGPLLGATAVGAIKAAQNIIGILHILFQGMENIVPVRASFYYSQNGIRGLRIFITRVLFWGGGATAIIALLAALFPVVWLHLFYGPEFENFGYILQSFAIIYLLVFIGGPFRAILRTLEKTRPIFIAYVLMSFFSVASAKPLLDNFGVAGVMIGIFGAEIILQLSLFFSIRKEINAVSF